MSNNIKDFETYEERDEAAEGLVKLKGWQIGKRLEKFEVSILIFRGNFDDLMNKIGLFKSPASLVLHDVRNSDELHNFFIEITRFIHNYLASAMTLVEHTRILKRELYENNALHQEFSGEYDAKINQMFVENSLHPFWQGLRNYILHKELPIVCSELDLNNLESNLLIDIVKLRENFDWSTPATKYLDSCNDSEPIDKVSSVRSS